MTLPKFIPWPYRILAIVLLIVAVFWAGWIKGANYEELKHDAFLSSQKDVTIAAMVKATAKTKAWQDKKDEALNDAAKRNQALQKSLAAAAASGDGLRNDLASAAATRDLSEYTVDACRKDVATRDAILSRMEAVGRRISGEAQGHADDSLMLQQAWPK